VLSTKIAGNKIWIGTSDFGIISLENEILTYYPQTIFSYPSPSISSIEIDNFNNVWFCHTPDSSRKNGLSYYNGNSFISFPFNIINTQFNHIAIDGENKWVSTYEGLLKYNGLNALQIFTTNNSLLSSKRVTAAVKDGNSALWITTSGGGLNKFKIN
jgi:ligand-binding sensor domain-containing protein